MMSAQQQSLFDSVLSGLDGIGYRGNQVQRNYQFEDWFEAVGGDRPPILKVVDGAAFGRATHSYESACFAIAASNGTSGPDLVAGCRSLGAPLAFEIEQSRVLLWRVEATRPSQRPSIVLAPGEVEAAFRIHASEWQPANILRAKNIGPVGPRQRDFVDIGLIPALEGHILAKLDPLLRKVFFDALHSYQVRHRTSGRPNWLFRLVFRALAGKVMADRRLPGFEAFATAPEHNALLGAVNAHFGDSPQVGADDETRSLVVSRFWEAFSFKNMSVPVLSFVWENTLVDEDIRKQLSIHGTPPSVARFIVNRLALEGIPEGRRYVVEPCCGSATFLLAAMQRLTELLPEGHSNELRHTYLQQRLRGFDVDAFGLEVARDCLMLADYPNSNHWVLKEEDVFATEENAPIYRDSLKRAGVVLCNPPYGKFTSEEQSSYGVQSIFKPVELLSRILDSTPNDCVLGFVMPHLLMAGQSYPAIRRRLAERFGSLEIVTLPDQGVFSSANYETVLLIAREPRLQGTSTRVAHGKVTKSEWLCFSQTGRITGENIEVKKVADAESTFVVPDLPHLWKYLRGCPTVNEATGGRVSLGIQWNIAARENSGLLMSDHPKEGFRLGIPPAEKTAYHAFLVPALKYMSFLPQHRKFRAFDRPWDCPKVLMNGSRKGRGPWRLAAFADNAGLVCYHSFLALWPTDDLSPSVLAAVLNGPLANAYVSTHATDRHVPGGLAKRIPMPRLDAHLANRIEQLVDEYVPLAQSLTPPLSGRDPERVLLEIDAAVLEGYDLPPRLERSLLDYFNGQGSRRPVSHPFEDYFPSGFRPCLPLARYISKDFELATAEAFRRTPPTDSSDVRRALEAACGIEGQVDP